MAHLHDGMLNDQVVLAIFLMICWKGADMTEVSIWRLSAKAAGIVTAIYILSVPWISNSPSEVTMNLINGTPATFVAWWALAAIFIWVWRKIGALALVPKILLMVAYAAVFWVLSNFLMRMATLFLSQ